MHDNNLAIIHHFIHASIKFQKMDQTNKIQHEKEDGLINGISSISLEDPSSHQMQNIDQFKEPKSAPAIKSFLDVNLNTNSPSNRPTSSSSLDSGLTTSSFNNNKSRINRKVGRFQRVESSWEDVPSSSSSNEGEDDEDDDDEEEDDSDTKTIKMRMQQIRAERSSESTPKRNSLSILLDHEDQWEDEDAIMAESDSGGSQITEITTTKNKNHSRNQSFSTTTGAGIMPPQSSSSASEDDGIRGTPQGGRSSRLPRRSSAQRALREYRKSRLALMQSESDNIGRYNKIMRGELVESEEDQESKNELRRADTMDMLDNMEPFTAGIGTESVDDADTSARAYDIRLRENNNNRLKISTSSDTPSRTSNHQKRNSQLPPLRSPRLPPRRLSTSPSIKVIPLKQSDPMIEEQQNSFSEDQYASVPASPADNTAMTNEWLSTVDGTRDTVLNGMKKPSPKIKSETLPNIESQTPRRHSRSNENINVHQNTSNLNGKANLISAQLDQLADATPPFSLWDYLKEEIMASDFDSTQEMKWERVTNFIAIPFWMEKIMLFGFFVCLDSFLYTFTILPIRFLVAIYCGFHNFIVWITGGQRRYLSSSHKCDILKTLLIISSCWILSRITDASKMYHSVRGQDVVKLYVIFNVLEIADRLCCSFGQDLLDSLFSRSTLARRKDGHQPYLRPLGFFALSLLYVLAHTLVLLYQLVTLNVAINSYDNALLTLLLSNQFVEIKGSVFKKFEKENLFQLTCADIVERFQLTLMLCSIGLRNLIEVAGAAGNSIAALTPTNLVDEVIEQTITTSTENLNKSKLSSPLSAIAMLGGLPASFSIFPSFSLLETIFTPVCIVLASEFLVDWLKHAFITKFNHIRPSVYGRFMDVLCRDLVMAGPVVRSSSSKRRHTFVDQSPVVSRRLGFASVPLACLLVRMTSQVMEMLHDDSHFDECAVPDWQKHSTNNITDGSGFPLEESISDFIWRMLRRPFELILSILFNNPKAILDNALHYAVSMAAWTLTIIIAWFFLIALKLILGTNLVSFASNRYSTMGQRENEEELNSRDRQPIGVDKEEMDYNSKLSQLIDKKDDDASRMGFAGQPLPTPAKYGGGGGGGGKNKGTESLMDVSRYTMVRSRIW